MTQDQAIKRAAIFLSDRIDLTALSYRKVWSTLGKAKAESHTSTEDIEKLIKEQLAYVDKTP
jgi:hypothetical protein